MLPWQPFLAFYIWVHTGATWRIRLNRPRAAAMRPLVIITTTTTNSNTKRYRPIVAKQYASPMMPILVISGHTVTPTPDDK